MPFNDLREYMDKLEEEGDLQHIGTEVDWNLEVGAIIRRCYDLRAPAPLFENIKGYPKGFRLLGAPVAASSRPGGLYARIALAMGLPPDSPVAALIEEIVKTYSLKPQKPRLVASGPCKENILVGDEVDLLRFPVPFIHEHDGGRYMGTWDVVVTRDPDSSWTNWGLYRLMVHDRNTLGGLIIPSQHIGMHYYTKYEARGRPMPFAVALGTEPLSTMIASAATPDGVDEDDIVGAMRGSPVEVVKCETVDLEVPATAEIVIEGEVLPQTRREEGPFGEYSGYQAPAHDPKPVYKVSAITYRHDPILPVVCPGVPMDDHLWMCITVAADVLHNLRTQGHPVKGVFVPPAGAQHIIVISVENRDVDTVRAVAEAVWAAKSGHHIPKIMVVDEDIDPYDMDQVFWAFSTRNHPGPGIQKRAESPAFPLWAFLPPEEKVDRTTTRVIFDCTWPRDWPRDYVPRKASFDSLWPQEVQQRVLENWNQYGYKTPPRHQASP